MHGVMLYCLVLTQSNFSCKLILIQHDSCCPRIVRVQNILQLIDFVLQSDLLFFQLSTMLCKVGFGVNLYQVDVFDRVLKDAFDKFCVSSGCQLLPQIVVLICQILQRLLAGRVLVRCRPVSLTTKLVITQ